MKVNHFFKAVACLLMVCPILLGGDIVYAQKEVNLVIAAGPIGGAFYPISGGIASIVNKKTEGININVQVTGGGVENTRLVGRGRVDLALVGADQAYYGIHKQAMFKKDDLKLETLGTLHPTVYQYVSLKKSNLKTVEDLKGRKVAIGEPGGGAEMGFNMLLQAAKWSKKDLKPVYLPYAQAVEQLADGLIDAAVIVAGVPTGAITSLTAKHEITLLEMPEKIWPEYQKVSPFSTFEVFKPGIYRGVDAPVKMVVGRIQLACRNGLDPEVAYKIAKALYTNLNELITHHAAAKFIDAETSYKTSIAMNKGAERFFKEAGYLK